MWSATTRRAPGGPTGSTAPARVTTDRRGPINRHTVGIAVAWFAAIRLATLGAIAIAAHEQHHRLLGVLTKADGLWYLRIAAHGYGPPPPIGPDGTYVHLPTLAFFPLYPGLVRVVAAVGMPYTYAALLVAAAAGLLAAALIAAWAIPVVGERGAIVLVVVWSLLPTSAVFDMAYAEPLFVAAAAATLLALQRHRYLAAALACSVAGLTRPNGAGLVLAVLIAVALEARRHGLDARLVAAAVVAPAGLLASLGHVAVVTGRLDGWFWLENRPWRSGFDGGLSFVRTLQRMLTGQVDIQWPVLMAGAVVIAFLAAYVVWLRRGSMRTPAEIAYVSVAGLLAIGERNYSHVKPRFLLVAFPVLAPLARRLAGRRVTTLVAVLVPVAAASLAWNAYLVAVWPASV